MSAGALVLRPSAGGDAAATVAPATEARALRAATLLAALAATVLATLAVGDLGASWAYGLILLGVAGFEALLARALFLRASPRVVLAGVVGNLSVITAYVVGRTAGLAIGLPALSIGLLPTGGSSESATGHAAGHAAGWADYAAQLEGGVVEAVGALDVALLAGLLGLVALLVSVLPARTRRVAVNVVLLAGIGLWVQRFSGVLG